MFSLEALTLTFICYANLFVFFLLVHDVSVNWPICARTVLGPSMPRDMGPSVPRNMGPSVPKSMGPSVPTGMGPSVPTSMGPFVSSLHGIAS